MIIPNVSYHQYCNVSGPSGTAAATTDQAQDGTATTASAPGGSGGSTAASPGSADAFGELSSLMQQFLLQLQGGQGGASGGASGSASGASGTGSATGTATGTAASDSVGVDGATQSLGASIAQKMAALSSYAANNGGLAANADRTLGSLYGPARAYAANHDWDVGSRFPGAVSAVADSGKVDALGDVTLGQAAQAYASMSTGAGSTG